MPLVLYKIDGSPPVRTVLMTAEILKLNYEPREINTIAGETRTPEFLEKNPLHTVPLLEDRGFILADSHAIITYLVSKYGAEKRAQLYPADLAVRATVDQRLFFDATILFPTVRSIIGSIIYEQAPGPSEKHIAEANEAYGVLEKYLEKTKFVAGDHLTLADVSNVAIVSSLDIFVPIDEKFEKVHAWFNTLKEEEWYQKANVPGLEQLAAFLRMAMEKNGGGSVSRLPGGQ